MQFEHLATLYVHHKKCHSRAGTAAAQLLCPLRGGALLPRHLWAPPWKALLDPPSAMKGGSGN